MPPSCPADRRSRWPSSWITQLDRVENFDTLDLAVFRAEDVKRTLVEEGWTE